MVGRTLCCRGIDQLFSLAFRELEATVSLMLLRLTSRRFLLCLLWVDTAQDGVATANFFHRPESVVYHYGHATRSGCDRSGVDLSPSRESNDHDECEKDDIDDAELHVVSC